MGKGTGSDFSFANLVGRPVRGAFDGGSVTGDAGAMLLREVDRRTGLIDRAVRALHDGRDAAHVTHSLADLVRQRVFQIALGHEDANDADQLRTDPALKAACERLPITGADLASQPTLSRLENAVSRTQLLRLAYALGDIFIASFPTPPTELLLDLDDTTDVVHGSQQLSLFNAHAGEHAYQPFRIYEGRTGRLVTTVLRPGCRAKGGDVVKILARVITHLRQAWPDVPIVLRGDSHFSVPEVHSFCRERGLHFVFGQSINSRLKERLAPTLAQAQELFDTLLADHDRAQRRAQATGQPAPPAPTMEPVRLFTEWTYQAHSWDHPLRVIAKAEVSVHGTNQRFIVTNFASSSPSFLYEIAYAGRGAMENFIKNHTTHLHSDRTSCHRFAANQFRLCLHSLAYMLLHAVQESLLVGTHYEKAYFNTIQERVLRVAARVVERATVIDFHWPSSSTLKDLFATIFQRLHGGAAPA